MVRCKTMKLINCSYKFLMLRKMDISKSFIKMKFVSEMFLLLAGLALCSAQPESSNRIANGNLAAPGQFPYMVSLQMLGDSQSQPTRGHMCAGALVSHRVVVTTAVCLLNYTTEDPTPLDPNSFRVFAGSNLLDDNSSADFVRSALRISIHPNFTGLPALVNNIAVINLVNDFPRGVVTPLALPASNFNPAEFTLCTIAGWGSINSSNEISVALRFAEKYVYNQNLCTSIYNTRPDTKNIMPSMICAVSYDLRSSNCFGDYGNPLVCDNTFTGVLFSSNNCTMSTFPEVYTRISNYPSWIRSVSGAPSLIKPGVLIIFLLGFITNLF